MNETIAVGLHLPNGPVGLTDGRVAVLEEDGGSRCLSIIEMDGKRREIWQSSGRPTGLAVDGDGCFWVAGGPDNSLIKLSPQGDPLQVIEGGASGPFLFPHDLAFGPDGLLYMTDSGVRISDLIEDGGIRPDFLEASYDGRVYQIDPVKGRVMRALANGLLMPCGIAFDSAGLLYYSEVLTGNIYRQVVGSRQEIFAHALRSPMADRLKGPVGMAFDRDGTLYSVIYGQGDISLIDTAGRISGHIPTNGPLPTNIAFTPDGRHVLITEQQNGTIERITAPKPGLPLNMPVV